MNIVALLVALVLALTLHEFMHAMVSDWLGDKTARVQGRLTLNPAAHIDPFTTLLLPLILIIAGSPVVFGAAKPVPFNPWAVRWGKWGVALVAVAGPLTNLGIAIVFGLVLDFVPVGLNAYQLIGQIVTVNVAFFVFNMIPLPPLDGSRVLYAVAPKVVRDVMDRIEKAGMIVVFLLIFVTYPVVFPFISRATLDIVSLIVPGVGF